MLSILGNKFNDVSKYFFYLTQKIDFDIPCKLSPKDLHEMSKSIFWGK